MDQLICVDKVLPLPVFQETLVTTSKEESRYTHKHARFGSLDKSSLTGIIVSFAAGGQTWWSQRWWLPSSLSCTACTSQRASDIREMAVALRVDGGSSLCGSRWPASDQHSRCLFPSCFQLHPSKPRPPHLFNPVITLSACDQSSSRFLILCFYVKGYRLQLACSAPPQTVSA